MLENRHYFPGPSSRRKKIAVVVSEIHFQCCILDLFPLFEHCCDSTRMWQFPDKIITPWLGSSPIFLFFFFSMLRDGLREKERRNASNVKIDIFLSVPINVIFFKMPTELRIIPFPVWILLPYDIITYHPFGTQFPNTQSSPSLFKITHFFYLDTSANTI